MQNNKRRDFIKTMIIGGAALQIPLIYSCNSESLGIINIVIDNKNYSINTDLLKIVLNILFPKSKISPSATDLKTDIYYIWYLNDNNISSNKREYLAKTLNKINLSSKEKHNTSFTSLSKEKQEILIKEISNTNWGENYLSSLMTIIIESMLANPIYNCNPEKKGWNWLKFQGGYPQPTKINRYPELLSINHTQDER